MVSLRFPLLAFGEVAAVAACIFLVFQQ